ncbi:NAD(P)H-dependent oxidoreductase [Planctomycetota bacterium]|nr:NAD(P)H-dependent oxidoreductase [Planctomycetota bacterium]
MKPRILAFAGSGRKASFNGKLVQAGALLLNDAGAETTVINVKDFDIPLFDQDLEADGLPVGVLKLKTLAKDHDGYFISSPEYNGSLSPLLKNTIDWLSRPAPDEPRGAAFNGKTGAVVAASPGAMGGIRGLPHVRQILSGVGLTLVPAQLALGNAATAFSEEGSLTNERSAATLQRICTDLVKLTRALMKD